LHERSCPHAFVLPCPRLDFGQFLGWYRHAALARKATMLRTLVLLLLVTTAGATPALAQLPLPPLPFSLFEQGTPQERAACQGDVQKYCESALPDVMRVAQCLQINRQKISTACRQVLVSRGL
jgi:hypothetical protein